MLNCAPEGRAPTTPQFRTVIIPHVWDCAPEGCAGTTAILVALIPQVQDRVLQRNRFIRCRLSGAIHERPLRHVG